MSMSASQGWSCTICGTWTALGMTHLCPATPSPSITIGPTPDMERLLAYLDCIAAAVVAMAPYSAGVHQANLDKARRVR